MKSKFVLKKLDTTLNNVIQNGYLIRYDINGMKDDFDKFIKAFILKNNRTPFVYELVQELLKSLREDLRNEVMKIIYEKDDDWFLTTGQYLFFNLYNWTNNLTDIKFDRVCYSTNFLESWWRNFVELESFGSYPPIKYPDKVLLEITNNCNLDCIMCGVGKNGYDAKKNLSLDLLTSICDSVLRKISLLRLNGLGESTIIPNFLDYLDLIREIPLQLEIVTNLTVNNQAIWKYLIDTNTNFLISCDSANPQIFEAIRRRAKFSVFRQNLELIAKSVSHPLQAQIIFTLMEININELFGVLKLATELGLGGVIVNVVKSNFNNKHWIDDHIDLIRDSFYNASNFAKEYGINLKLPDHLSHFMIDPAISNPSSKKFCTNPWDEVYIRYNGDLTVCNMLNPYIYGNLNLMSFGDMWRGLNAQMFRNFINTPLRHPYCKDCYYLL